MFSYDYNLVLNQIYIKSIHEKMSLYRIYCTQKYTVLENV